MRVRLGALIAALAIVGCAPPPEPPTQAGIENELLGIRLTGLPQSLAVDDNRDTELVLRPTVETREGRIWFTKGQEVHAVNLVLAVNDHKGLIESLPEGNYLGAQEILGDFGSAFYSRGRYSQGDRSVEETVVFAIHPWGDRLLSVHSQYPAAADSAERVEELIDLLSRVEW